MLGSRIKKLILVRLLAATLLLYCPHVFPETLPLVFYAAASTVCVSSIIYLIWYLTRRRYRWLALLQIFGDLILETYLVYFTGGTESLFAAFYILSILSTALVLGEKAAILQTTIFSCLSYLASSLWATQTGMSASVSRDPLFLYYGLTVRVAVFIAVGQLSCYLSGTVLELKRQLKLLERLSALGEVVSKIAHEIRNPLSSIRTAAEVLAESLRGKLSPDEEKMTVIIDKESNRLTQTLERILSYTRQVRPNPKMLLLDDLVERALSMVRLRKDLHPEEILVEKKYDLKTRVYADEEQILGALLNLMQNAYQAMAQGGHFGIGAEERVQGTRLDLEDSGGGIPQEKLKDLFTPFKSTKKGGTGLGLSEVQKVVMLHEGKIDVESHPGRGTIFHLFFPKP